ncbi:MAG: histidinol-phosphatase [Actinomycetaceae bacterium]|nr:histidinol-phosphatase [Actinomycetaceae bacterium]
MSPSSRYLPDLELAHHLADAADAVTLERFQAADLQVSRKRDRSFVTDADRATEAKIRQLLSTARPDDGVYGEELGVTGSKQRQWIIDPIDGTANYLRGVPVWATLIALVEDGEVVVSVVSAPALHRRWWASRGNGAFAAVGTDLSQARRLSVSDVSDPAQASVSFSSFTGWVEAGRDKQFFDLLSHCWRTRAFGDFWSYMLVAEGVVDIACEPELETYDMAALIPIVEEAGGRFTSLCGEPGPWGGNGLATNGHLHTWVLETLDWKDC